MQLWTESVQRVQHMPVLQWGEQEGLIPALFIMLILTAMIDHD